MSPSRKRPVIAEEQGYFLEPVEGQESVGEVMPAPPAYDPVSVGPEGSYVNIAERAEHIMHALQAIGKSNQRVGFGFASKSGPHKKAIAERYDDKLPYVQDGAETKGMTLAEEAKKSFDQATGYAALSGAGLFKRPEILPHYILERRRFFEKYGGTGKANVRKRDQYQSLMRRQIKASKKISQSPKI